MQNAQNQQISTTICELFCICTDPLSFPHYHIRFPCGNLCFQNCIVQTENYLSLPPTFTRFCVFLSGISEQKVMLGFNCLKTKSEFWNRAFNNTFVSMPLRKAKNRSARRQRYIIFCLDDAIPGASISPQNSIKKTPAFAKVFAFYLYWLLENTSYR